MGSKGWPFTKPVGVAIGLSLARLTDQYRRLESKSLLSHKGYRFSFRLNQSADVLVKITSVIANQKGWHRAGYLANLLTGGPIRESVQAVERLYFGQQHVSIAYTGLEHYLEFWPHVWITDYRIELWAKAVLTAVVIPETGNEGGLLLFNTGEGLTEEFTFFGDLIVFP
ncbi:hypothetical protein QGP82_18705 [Leptothoe sp. LEGE 181152]|nr:hypothetical protein [Leptothoe sp. LEGE 181152]